MVVDFVDTDIGQEQGSNTHRYVVQMYLNNFKTSTNCCQQQADDNKLRKKIDSFFPEDIQILLFELFHLDLWGFCFHIHLP